MNTIRVGAEDQKLLVAVDLLGVVWRRLRYDIASPVQSQALDGVAASSLAYREDYR